MPEDEIERALWGENYLKIKRSTDPKSSQEQLTLVVENTPRKGFNRGFTVFVTEPLKRIIDECLHSTRDEALSKLSKMNFLKDVPLVIDKEIQGHKLASVSSNFI